MRNEYINEISESLRLQFGADWKQKLKKHPYREHLLKELKEIVKEKRFNVDLYGIITNLVPREGGIFRWCIDSNLLKKLSDLCRSLNTSLSTLLCGLFAYQINRDIGCRAVRMYIPFSARDQSGFENVVGWLTSEIILCLSIEEEMSLEALVAETSQQLVKSSEFKYYAHESLLNDFNLSLDILAPYFFNYMVEPNTTISDFSPMHKENGSGHFGLRCEMVGRDNGIEIIINYAREKYVGAEIQQCMESFGRLLNTLQNDPYTSLVR